MRLGFLFACLPCVVALAACSSIDKPPATNGSSGGGGGGGSTTPPTDAGANDAGGNGICTDLTESGTLVDVLAVQGDPPVSTGGTIADGTYVLTDDSVYVGAAGTPGPIGTAVRSTIRITGGGTAMERVVDTTDNSNKTTTTVEVLAMTVSTTSLVLTTTCPQSGLSEGTQFTTTGSNLFITNYTSKERRTYALK